MTPQEKKKIYMKEYRRVNKDRIRQVEKLYYANNPEVIERRYKKAYNKHKDKIKKLSNKYYHKNKEIILQKQKEYFQKKYPENKQKIKEATRRFRKNNPGWTAFHCAKYRAKKLKATPPWLTDFDLDYIKNLYAQAKWLTQNTETVYHVDHIYPLQGKEVCGLHTPTNLQIITGSENSRKSNKIPVN
jgi:hypothetical protein